MTLTQMLVQNFKKFGPVRGPEFANELVAESVAQAKYNPRHFSIRQCAEESFGPGWEAKLRRFAGKKQAFNELTFESQDAVDVSAFSAVTGSVIVEQVEAGHAAAMAPVDGLVGRWDTPNNLDVQTVAYSGKASDKSKDLAPLEPYPKTGLTPYRITIPAPIKHGQIVQVSMEAVIADSTSQLIDGAREVGEQVGLERKKRILKVVLGITNNYKRNGTAYNTYLTSGAWINALDDFDQANGPEEFDRLYQLMEQMVDPITGEVVEINQSGLKLFVPGSNAVRTRKNVNAQTINDKSSTREIITANPMSLPEPMSDLQARAVLIAASVSSAIASTYAVFGETVKAFKERVVKDFEVLERDGELASEAGWEQDVVYAAKARFFGIPFVYDPYYVYRGRKTA
ncbi:hypothetical protein BH11PLA2_BH11PLA2_32790 [soil metagenome]